MKLNLTSKKWTVIGTVVGLIGVIVGIYTIYIPKSEINISGENNTVNIYSQREVDVINEIAKRLYPSYPLADIIVKINAKTTPEGVGMEYQYIDTLKCGDGVQGRWKGVLQELMLTEDMRQAFDVLEVECSITKERRVIYFDITDWFGR